LPALSDHESLEAYVFQGFYQMLPRIAPKVSGRV